MAATRSQSTDEVASNSTAVTTHMNKDHKDSLAYLVTHHADLPKLVSPNEVEMVSIDRTKITVRYQGNKIINVPFYPYISSSSAVRQRVVELCATSERVVKSRKRIVIFKLPKIPFLTTVATLVLYLALRSEHFASHPLVTSLPSDWLLKWNTFRNVTLGGQAKLDALVLSAARVHILEATGMLALSLYRGASVITALKWTLTTFVIGFPSWLTFFKINSNSAIARRSIYGHGINKRKED